MPLGLLFPTLFQKLSVHVGRISDLSVHVDFLFAGKTSEPLFWVPAKVGNFWSLQIIIPGKKLLPYEKDGVRAIRAQHFWLAMSGVEFSHVWNMRRDPMNSWSHLLGMWPLPLGFGGKEKMLATWERKRNWKGSGSSVTNSHCFKFW